MKDKKTENQSNNVIYLLLSKSKKTFFIAKGTEEKLRETYRHHIKMRRDCSRSFISSCDTERPCLAVLEKIDPEEEANLLLVWLRILRENGYISFNYQDMIQMSECLNFDNAIAYEKRKNIDISALLSCDKCLVPKYNRETCVHYPTDVGSACAAANISRVARKREKKIHLSVSEEEYQCICDHARELNMQVNNYIRRVATNPIIRPYNYSIISAHTNEISQIRNSINRLVFTIDAQNNYLPRDIASIVGMMEEIFAGERKLLKTVREQWEKTEENDRKLPIK